MECSLFASSPKEIHQQVLGMLEGTEALNYATVCTLWNEIITEKTDAFCNEFVPKLMRSDQIFSLIGKSRLCWVPKLILGENDFQKLNSCKPVYFLDPSIMEKPIMLGTHPSMGSFLSMKILHNEQKVMMTVFNDSMHCHSFSNKKSSYAAKKFDKVTMAILKDLFTKGEHATKKGLMKLDQGR